jgi:hypothetical protein
MQDEIYTENPTEAELNFHYNREDRLKDAPTVVKKYYAGELPTAPKGLFKALVHTKSSRFTFMALILVLALVVALIFFGPKANQNSIGNTEFNLSAFSFEEKVFVSIKTETKINQTEIQIPLEISISALDKESQILNQEKIETVITENEEFIRTIFTDYDIISVEVEVLNTESKEKISLSCSVTKN